MHTWFDAQLDQIIVDGIYSGDTLDMYSESANNF